MGNIIYNKSLTKEYYLLKIEQESGGKMGQFYMLRAWDNDPLLSRPLSVFDRDNNSITFLYKVVGKGTKYMSQLKKDDNIICQGPYGSSFPNVKGKIAMVGGGIGIAPLHLAAKELQKDKNNEIDMFFSLRGREILRKELSKVSDHLVLRTNERVVDLVDYDRYDYVFTCGPKGLMEDVYINSKNKNSVVYASLESRMACGIGICYGCTFKTKNGNKLTCKDGPVFLGSEVF
ncbi:MAG TPA: dihydroorotate dehydrogenase electron transfer subunit [Tissierellaceae bacterium]|nr:dihydroorotate dehydrogenase electron transfer subunit [Tissierellaceae bacterium]